jgi:hypothetical protein
MLTRQYGQLGRNQLQGANQAGVIRGGALLQSAAKRAENQAIDRQPLDTNFQRFLADNAQQAQRTQQDYETHGGGAAGLTDSWAGWRWTTRRRTRTIRWVAAGSRTALRS